MSFPNVSTVFLPSKVIKYFSKILRTFSEWVVQVMGEGGGGGGGYSGSRWLIRGNEGLERLLSRGPAPSDTESCW